MKFCRLIIFCLWAAAAPSAFGQIRQLEKELTIAKSDTQKLRILTELHWLYLYENPGRARQLALQQIDISKAKPSLKKQLAQGYNDLGLCEQVAFKWIEAIRWHEMAYRIRLGLGDEYGQASSLSKLAVSYGEMGEYARCLQYNLKALPLFEKLDNQPALARLFGNLAANYAWLKQWKLADSMAMASERFSKLVGDSVTLAQAWSLQAQVLQEGGNVEKAIALEKKCLALFEMWKDTAKIMAALNNLAFDYGLLNLKMESRKGYALALELAEKSHATHDQIRFAANLANKELELGNQKQATQLLQKAEALARTEQDHQLLPQILRTWGFLFVRQGKAEEANRIYMAASQLQDSLLSEKFASQYARYQTAYDLEKKARENQALNADLQLKSAHISRQRLWLAASILFFVLVLSVLYFLWKQNQLNIRQKQEAERHAHQEKLAREILSAEEKERTRIARELHDGVGQQLVAAFLNLENLQLENPYPSDRLQDAKALVEDSLQEIRSVSHTMLSNALLRSGLAGAVRDFVQKIRSRMAIHLDIQNLDQRLDSTLELVLFRILQELVGNVIRHAQATEVYIQLFREEDFVVLMVEDNGIGFKPGSPTQAGVGLRNIRSRIDFLGGEMEMDTHPGKGCSVVVRVPVS